VRSQVARRGFTLEPAVTVLSTDDPVRVFERFSTLNALSNGRAEVLVGRGSFTESFPLFGYNLEHYEPLFEEKLNLFVETAQRSACDVEGSAPRTAVESTSVSAQ
jgi:alkanesulfonate monooxygenase SsuD/methylene tetrahydromethanopterin reductase-like flavin-dependent oxidoreductase (luciferase family)